MAGTLSNRRFALAAAVGAALVAVVFLALFAMSGAERADAEAAARACANADTPTADASKGELRQAVGCLLAKERAKRDRKRARPNAALRSVAQKHTRKMLETNCFDHQCAGEASLQKRIERSGYVGPGDRYGYGEITGCGPSPRTMVEQWMDKPVARKTILDRSFRHLGIGVAKGAPKVAEGCAGRDLYATYTILFAWRRG